MREQERDRPTNESTLINAGLEEVLVAGWPLDT